MINSRCQSFMLPVVITILLAFGVAAGAWFSFEGWWDRTQFGERSEHEFVRNVRADYVLKVLSHESDLIIIDVRPGEGFDAGHIPGALNAPFSDGTLDSTALAGIPRDRPVLVYCDGGYRSRKSLSSLQNLGFHSVYHLHRGFISWKAAKGVVESGVAT